jgi:hypothetical protein
MNDKTDNSVKNQHQKTYLFIGIVWLALGLFGLIFDPTKKLIITIQIVLGSVILIYYFWLKLK